MNHLSPESSKPVTAILFAEDQPEHTFSDLPLYLLPLMGKSALQRAVEQCVQASCTTIWVITSRYYHQIQSLLENGERWGCQIRYLVNQQHQDQMISAGIDIDEHGRYLIGRADCIIKGLDAHVATGQCNTLFCQEHNGAWLGWGIFSGKWITSNAMTTDWHTFQAKAENDSSLQFRHGETVLSATTPDAFYQNIQTLFTQSASNTQHIGHHVKIHTSSQIIEPVFIGNNVTLAANTHIGPNVLIEDGCYIDEDSSLQNCYVSPDTYIGKNLDVIHKVSVAATLYDARLNCKSTICDPWIISAKQDLLKSHVLQKNIVSRWFGYLIRPFIRHLHAGNH